MKVSFSTNIILLSTLLYLTSCGNANFDRNLPKSGFDTVKLKTDIEDSLSKSNDTISIVAVGDVMIGSSYPSKSSLPPNDAKNSFAAVDNLLKGDIVFGNLEGALIDNGTPAKDSSSITSGLYSFSMPERYGGIIKKAGFNLISIANNHTGDFKLKGRQSTAKILDSLEINYAGQTSKPTAVFTINNVRYGFCAFAPNANTVSINDLAAAKIIVARLKDSVDIIIVSFHGGAEGSSHETVTREKEIFYKENRGNVYEFAHAVIDAGADVVLGHGPHVTRAVEVYKKKFIAYSLGNFNTYGTFNLSGPSGFAPLLNLKINGHGDFLFVDVTSIKQDKLKGLTLDKSFKAFKTLKRLTDADFLDHRLVFSENSIKQAD